MSVKNSAIKREVANEKQQQLNNNTSNPATSNGKAESDYLKNILGILPTASAATPTTTAGDDKVSGVDPMMKKSEGDLKKMLGIGGVGNSQHQPQQMQHQPQQPQHQPQQIQQQPPQPQQENTELSVQLLAVLNQNTQQPQQQPQQDSGLTDSMKLMNLIGVKPTQQQAGVHESFSEPNLLPSRHQV